MRVYHLQEIWFTLVKDCKEWWVLPSEHPWIESSLPNKTEIHVGPSRCSFQDLLFGAFISLGTQKSPALTLRTAHKI